MTKELKEFLNFDFILWANFGSDKVKSFITKDLIENYMSGRRQGFRDLDKDLTDEEFWEKYFEMQNYLKKEFLGKWV